MARKVGQGGTITLDATYQEGTGELIDPTDPRVDIIDSDDVQVVTDAVPTNTAVGRYEYDYMVAPDAPLGSWTAHWTGTINGLPVEGEEPFEVVEAGDISFDSDGWPTVVDLAAYQRVAITSEDDIATATQAIELAKALIRSETRQHIDRVNNDLLILAGAWTQELWLPERPVIRVAAVVLDGQTLAVDTYAWTAAGRLTRGLIDEDGFQRAGVAWSWGSPTTTVAVTYTHGYSEIPGDLRAICLSLAARRFQNPAQVQSETIGDYSYTLQTGELDSSLGLTSHEQQVCARYRIDVRSVAV